MNAPATPATPKPTKSFQRPNAGLSISRQWRDLDAKLAAQAVEGFVPDQVFDFHSHLVNAAHFPGGAADLYVGEGTVLGIAEYDTDMEKLFPGRKRGSLQFGIPLRDMDYGPVNRWIAQETLHSAETFHLAVVRPDADPSATEAVLSTQKCRGAKVYHLLSGRENSYDCRIEDYAPEWLWELLDAREGILMLHLVRDRAIADPENLASLRRLTAKYPRCRVVLAHIARSFCYRHAREGLSAAASLESVLLDTSVVTETGAFQAALEHFGPGRILYGSDFPCSQLRGRCVALGDSFYWLHDNRDIEPLRKAGSSMTFTGIESLLCLREACEDYGATAPDVRAIFYGNAHRLLGLDGEPDTRDATSLWSHAREVITCGTGLLSKRREQFDPLEWPAYFSRCQGSRVWDMGGKSYLDIAGGVGAILLGYADPDVNRHVRRRMSLGSYCTLVSPEEIALAELLLELNPWAGQVRYARGGGEAVAMAVRIARAATGKSGVLFCGYHGWHDWYLAANLGSDSALDGHLLPGLKPLGVPRELLGTSHPFRYNNRESFETALAALDGNFAAVVMEPMRSEWPRDNFLEMVREAAHQRGAVFVLDEVTSGWRFGFPGAHTVLGIEPDLAVYAKAMSNGYPAGAIVGKTEVMAAAGSSFISSSFWTDGIGTAASVATIQKMRREDVCGHVNALGATLKAGLEALAVAHPELRLIVSGMPSSPNLRFDLGELANAAKIHSIRSMLGRGFLSSSQLFLFLTHTQEHIQSYLSAMEEVCCELEGMLANGSLAHLPTGAAPGGFARLV